MPEISRFFGIVIKMYFDEHPPPHFHAEYGEHTAVIDIQTLSPIAGDMPPRALGLVVEWASQYQQQLLDLANRAADHQSLYRIPPLR
jgi:hypothetical protein